jgi:hypothetical protein
VNRLHLHSDWSFRVVTRFYSTGLSTVLRLYRE